MPWYARQWSRVFLIALLFFIFAGSYAGWLAFARRNAPGADGVRHQDEVIDQDLRREHLAGWLEVQISMRYAPEPGRLYGAIHVPVQTARGESYFELIPPVEGDDVERGAGQLRVLTHRIEPLQANNLFIKLIHPTQLAKDIKLVAQVDQDSTFSVGLPRLDKARWQVIVENDRRDWRLNGTWQWPQQQEIRIEAVKPLPQEQ